MPAQAKSSFEPFARLLLAAGFCLYLVLFAYNSLTRTRLYTLDSFNYIDVARNIRLGNGVAQSIQIIADPLTLSERTTLTPFTIQAPLYPVMIALVSLTGVVESEAALLVSAIAMGFVLVFCNLLGREVYDEPTAWLAIGLLILSPNLEYVTRLAWSEGTAIALMLFSLWMLVRTTKTAPGRRSLAYAGLAGLGAGMAFAARYALAPLLLFGIGVILFERRQSKSCWIEGGGYLAGWLLSAGPVIAHNYLSIGRPLPETLASDRTIIASLADVLNSLFGNYISLSLRSEIHYFLLAGFFLVVWIIAYRQGRGRRYFKDMVFRTRRYILILWPAVYVIFILGLRSLSHFDELDLRLVAPAVPTLVIMVTAIGTGLLHPVHPGSEQQSDLSKAVGRQAGTPTRWLLVLTGLILVIACGREILLAMNPPARSFEEQIKDSPRLSWIGTHTTPDDLIIGDGAAYIPVLFDRPSVISFSGYPYTIQLGQEALREFVRQNCGRFDNFYLILGSHPGSEQKHRQQYGDFIGRLMYGKMKDYPGLELLLESEEGYIYRLDYCN